MADGSGYDTRVLPRISSFWLGGRLLAPFRASLLAPVHGRVLEVGFGSGTSLPHYPATVRHLVGLDISAMALHLAGRRAEPPFPVHLVRGSIEEPPLRPESFDFAVTTWVMCLLPEPALALARIRSLLSPGGTLLFLEHGRAEPRLGAAVQSVLSRVTRHLCGGCRLDRQIDQLVADAGFDIQQLHKRPLDPTGLMTLYQGVAVPSEVAQ